MNTTELPHMPEMPLEEPNHSRIPPLLCLALLVVLVRFAFFMVYPANGPHMEAQEPDGWLTIARHVVNGDGYIWPYYDAPTARRGPTVVFFFAGVTWLFGNHNWVILGMQWGLDIGTTCLIYILGLTLFRDRRIAFVAALLFAGYGSGLIYTLRAWSEPLFTFLLATFALSLLNTLRQPVLWRTALCGLLLGVVILARPVMQFFPLVIFALFVWSWGWRRQLISHAAMLSLTVAVVLSPWIVRNYLVFNAFIPASSHRGNPLHQSNFMLGEPDYWRYRTVHDQWPVLRTAYENYFGEAPNSPDMQSYAQAVRVNEYQMDQAALQESLKVIRAHPDRFVKLSLVRFLRLWFGNRFINMLMGDGHPIGYLIALMNGSLLALAIAAFLGSRGPWVRLALPLMLLIAYNTAIYTLTLALARYTIPLMPYVMLFAAVTLVRFLPPYKFDGVRGETRYLKRHATPTIIS